MNTSLSNYKALTFDCYGTMIDWESGIWDAMQPLILKNKRDDITRQIGLEAYAIIEAEQERQTPDMLYPQLLSEVHTSLARYFDLQSTTELDTAFGASLPYWPAFADSADALRILKKHFKLVILSNVNRDGFAASNRRLGVEFDAIYTAEDIGSYKPDPTNFKYMLEHLEQDLGISANQILHTAQSMHHDHVPASQFGLAKAWIDRQNLQGSDNWGATARVDKLPSVDFRFNTLAEMAATLTK
ncbi:MAG: haloacid dehalogenase type II [Gammaproteobacteria bacterium]|nr:haloacid dehalogenase type II [Gammaproteobacteria bacterium]